MASSEDSEMELAEITLAARTALSTILGYTEMLSEDLVAGEAIFRGDLTRIRSEALVVSGLIARLEGQVDLARQKADTDPLTGIANRRAFDVLSQAFFDAPPTLSLILLDLDHFKTINDTYGHPVGDDVLKEVVNRLRGGLRTTDLLARLSGDEFVILLPATPAVMALPVAERLRRALAERPVPTQRGLVPVTASVGVATRKSSDSAVNDLISRADRAMYGAKNGGRNRAAPELGDSLYPQDC